MGNGKCPVGLKNKFRKTDVDNTYVLYRATLHVLYLNNTVHERTYLSTLNIAQP